MRSQFFHPVFRVWQRNFDVYLHTWFAEFISPLLEPLMYLLAFGVGLGAYIKGLSYGGGVVDYLHYLAPAIVAMAIVQRAFFECTYGTFVRMYYQKTFDAMICTPLSVQDVIAGELFWGATKSLIDAGIILGIIAAFHMAVFPHLLLILPVSFLGGLVMAGIAMIFTAVTPTIDLFNIPTFIYITPMVLFSGTFFPLDSMPAWVKTLAWFFPLTHVTVIVRSLSFGHMGADLIAPLVWLVVATPPLFIAGILLMKRRLIQ